jgi:hypothetical protein
MPFSDCDRTTTQCTGMAGGVAGATERLPPTDVTPGETSKQLIAQQVTALAAFCPNNAAREGLQQPSGGQSVHRHLNGKGCRQPGQLASVRERAQLLCAHPNYLRSTGRPSQSGSMMHSACLNRRTDPQFEFVTNLFRRIQKTGKRTTAKSSSP